MQDPCLFTLKNKTKEHCWVVRMVRERERGAGLRGREASGDWEGEEVAGEEFGVRFIFKI